MFHRGKLHNEAPLTCQEPVQCLRIHFPALGLLDGVDDLKGLIGFGPNHHPCETERRGRGGGRVSGVLGTVTSARFVLSGDAPGVVSLSFRVGLWSSNVCSMTYMVSTNRPARKV